MQVGWKNREAKCGCSRMERRRKKEQRQNDAGGVEEQGDDVRVLEDGEWRGEERKSRGRRMWVEEQRRSADVGGREITHLHRCAASNGTPLLVLPAARLLGLMAVPL